MIDEKRIEGKGETGMEGRMEAASREGRGEQVGGTEAGRVPTTLELSPTEKEGGPTNGDR